MDMITPQARCYFVTRDNTGSILNTDHRRETVGHGALRAAQWLARRKPGLDGMPDMRGL